MTARAPTLGDGMFATKSDYAYGRLRGDILKGTYLPGTVLNQAQLAEAIGISTTPLRESLRRLSAEGLVELSSHRDARVAPLTADEAREIMEMRNSLDPLALEAAALRRDQDDIRRIVAAHERLERSSADGAVIDIRAHREFHTALYQACHNKLLISTLDSLWDKAERYRLLGLQAASTSTEALERKKSRKSEEHADLVDSVFRGDTERAGAVMRRHIQHSLVAKAVDSLAPDEPANVSDEIADSAEV